MDGRLARARQQVRQKGGPDASTVLYIGRIPHGFFEDQMRGFFSQFGPVTRLRISRNKKTGHSKHYGFVEFASPEVAAIVADCMHNYLVAGHILQARLMPAHRQHTNLWKGANKRFRPIPRRRIAVEQHNRERTEAQVQKQISRLLKREEERRQKLAAAGIKYKFPGLKDQVNGTSSQKSSS